MKPRFRVLFVLLLSLGLLFRLVNLDQKIFWVDEVATVIRAVGYTKTEIVAQLADGQPRRPSDLLAYQRLTPDRSLTDSLTALSRSPEHAPLYFLLTRFWMQLFGSSVGAIRSFSVLCSLFALPALGWFCRELFGQQSSQQSSQQFSQQFSQPQISQIAVALMAVSPFFVAYAQEARPYSLWLLTILLSNGSLLRALRLNSAGSWTLYALTLALSLYSSLLSGLLAIGQSLYVIWVRRDALGQFGLALFLAGLTFLPWIWVILHHQQALEANTTWMRTAIQPLAMLAIWLYSIAILWFDVPVVAAGWGAVLQAGVAAVVLAIIGYALWQFCQTPRSVRLFIAALILPIPLVLIGLDLLLQGQSSATPRYLIPVQLGFLITVAHLCSPLKSVKPRISPLNAFRKRTGSRAMISLLLSLSLISCWGNLDRSPAYQKARNQANPEIAALINRTTSATVLAEPNQTIDLLSLSHELSTSVDLRIAPPERLLDALSSSTCQPIFLFNPSQIFLNAATARGFQPSQIYQPILLTPEDIHLTLWSLPCSS
jgi:uncharacterized membrane protein